MSNLVRHIFHNSLRLILTTSLVLVSQNAAAQPVGNEWIDFNQTYYKISIAQTGFYKLTYQDLLAAGFPVQTVDPRKIQLFFRGTEQAIEVSGQLDARFDPQDIIVFYGQRNDGTLDKQLYADPMAQPHAYYNLFSDTAVYFLTWRLDNQFGKRVPVFFENNVNNLPQENHYFQEHIILQSSNYSAGRTYPEGSDNFVHLTAFDYGEGWTGSRIGINQNADFTFKNLSDLFTSDGKPLMEVLLAGRNNRRHKVELFAGNTVASLRSLGEIDYEFYNNARFSSPLEWTDIAANGDLFIRARVKGYNDGIPDFSSVSFVKITVPRQWKISSDTLHIMSLRANPLGKSFIRINNSLTDFSIYDITDPYQLVKIGFNHTGNITTAMVDNTVSPRKLAVHNNRYLNPAVKKIDFVEIKPAIYDFLIISHKSLMAPVGNLADPVKAYADYRASAAGGGLNPFVAEIDQLYDQFAYGEKTPLAIRRFCDFMIRNGDPKFLFLIGKGLDVNYNYYRQNPVTYSHKNFIPPAGYPASDIFFTAGLGGTTHEPALATGRLSAQKPEDVANYLNKIKEMESQPFNGLWRKELIHLSGGLTASELNMFSRYVKDLKNLAEDDYFGGKALLMSKKTNFSTELVNISEEVNNGKALITFFGHSGSTATDLDIGYVSDDGFGYRNKGKYPVFLINGCNTGHIFGTSYTIGEDWMMAPDRGAAGFIASVSLGYPGYLKRYSDYFYGVALNDSLFLNKPMGEVKKEVSKRYIGNVTTTPFYIAHMQQMILQGDPFYKIFPPAKPDYSITDTDLLLKTYSGNKVTALTDSFAIGIIVRNFGKTTRQPLSIAVERVSENGYAKIYGPLDFEPVKHLDTLWYTIHRDDFNGYGKNYFTVHLDYYNRIDELDENNNAATFTYFIPLNSPRNIFPPDFSIVNSRNIELVAQTSDLLGENRDFIVEIDTVSAFNSLFKKQLTINGKVLIKQQFQLMEKDSVVYFWRTRFASPLPEEDDGWSVSSFTYIQDGPEGWAQTNFAQIIQNSLTGLIQDGNKRQFKFKETENEIVLRTFGPDHPENSYQDVELYINGLSYIFSTRFCTNNSINLVAFDKSSTIPYLGMYFGGYNELDRRSCGRLPQIVNNFLNHEIENPSTDYLSRYIDSISDGDFILLFSIGNVTYQNWPTAVKNKLGEIGVSSDLFTTLQNGYPLIILGRKGSAPGTATVVLPDYESPISPLQQELNFTRTIKGKYSKGNITTSLIGPATAWGSVFANAEFLNDDCSYDIIAIGTNGKETVLQTNVKEPESDISSLVAKDFPYLKLRFNTWDEIDFTPAHLNKWLVVFDPAPEGILLLADGESTFTRKKQEGENFSMDFVFENISRRDFTDSIPVHYSNFNQNLRRTTETKIKLPPVSAGTRHPFSLDINTLNKVGKNNLGVDANPRILPEQYYFNNYIAIDDYLDVEKDKTNPILDVLVDGRYLMDGDIVSPTPLILVRLKDENKFLLKSDTANVDIMLKQDCDACTFKRISFTHPQVKWVPASAKNDFQVEYQPEKLENGRYVLQVQASDESGNPSGTQPYRVRFEVINEAAITNFYPYPNPFSTSTRFVFTLTGSEIPDRIKIQIMTISGKIVREIDQDELGPIRIGHNMTSFAWDGRDEYGDQLANGVYLYKVEVQNAGRPMEKRESSGDRAFRKGFGKIYLLR